MSALVVVLLVLVVAILVVAAIAVALQLPEIRRYMKIRSM